MTGHLLFIYGIIIQGAGNASIPLSDVLADFIAIIPAKLHI